VQVLVGGTIKYSGAPTKHEAEGAISPPPTAKHQQ
jgi:hypothetical protein